MNTENDHQSSGNKHRTRFVVLTAVVIVFVLSWFIINSLKDQSQSPVVDETVDADKEFKDGIHIQTGLKKGEGLTMVIAHCTACHSAEVIIQNRMNEERWNATIKWMQETQNLWDLGENQKVIVNYLVKNYPVINKGRRAKLDDIEWYELED